MWNKPTEKELANIPKLYATEDTDSVDKMIVMHFFIGGSDWYIAEYGSEDKVFFGYAILNGDLEMAEWGYVSLDELDTINHHGIQIDRDLHWTPKRFSEIKL